MVKAVEERSRSSPTPTVDAATQTRIPAATPSADIVDARGPAPSALRMIRAVSGPGVAMSKAESATHATNLPSTSNDAPLRLRSRVGSGEELDDLGVVLRRIDVVKAVERGHGVDQLGPVIEHLARTGVAFERHELVPKLARQHHRRRQARSSAETVREPTIGWSPSITIAASMSERRARRPTWSDDAMPVWAWGLWTSSASRPTACMTSLDEYTTRIWWHPPSDAASITDLIIGLPPNSSSNFSEPAMRVLEPAASTTAPTGNNASARRSNGGVAERIHSTSASALRAISAKSRNREPSASTRNNLRPFMTVRSGSCAGRPITATARQSSRAAAC